MSLQAHWGPACFHPPSWARNAPFVLIVDPVPFRAMPTASQHGNEVKSTSFVLCLEAAMMERAPMASIIGAGTNLKTALVMQMFWQLLQFAYDSSE